MSEAKNDSIHCSCQHCPYRDCNIRLSEELRVLKEQFSVMNKTIIDLKFQFEVSQRNIENHSGTLDARNQFMENCLMTGIQKRLKHDLEEALVDERDYIDDVKDDFEEELNDIRANLAKQSNNIEIVNVGFEKRLINLMNAVMEPYGDEFNRLEDSEAAHGELLHKMIRDNANLALLKKAVLILGEKTVQWRNPENNHDALNVALRHTSDHEIWKYFAGHDNIPAICESCKYIPVGTRVKRGRDWGGGFRLLNKDGNTHGTVVVGIDDSEDWFHVEFDNGYSNGFRFGYNNIFHLQVIQ